MKQVTLFEGDNRASLGAMPENSVDAVVCDPPYNLTSITKRFGKPGSAPARSEGNDGSFARVSRGFMNLVWDATGIERDPEFWAAVYRVLKPGGFVFAFSGARTGHWQACAMETAGFIMHPMHAWIYGCMDPETECLTRRGWSKYWEIAADDEVLQWDAETGALTWVVPQAVHEYPFDGEMVVIENRNTRQVLTPNHRVYAKVRRHARHPKPSTYEVVEAGALDLRSSAWQVDLPLAGDLRDGETVDPAYAYLVGWWLTDAWPHNDEHSFYLTGPMADRLRAEFPDRALPWGVLGWDRPARAALYRGLMDGAGSQPGGDAYAHTFWSMDQERRDVFMALALSLGMRCHEDAAKGAVYVNTLCGTTQIQNRHRSARMPYKGMVWCLTVPTGAFVVRRDGKPFITGNSGFPKGHDAAMAIDKSCGAAHRAKAFNMKGEKGNPRATEFETNGRERLGRWEPKSDKSKQWDGWKYGTQTQKPAMEPIYLGQKPYDGKPVESILKWGVGAFNIDATRVPGEPWKAHTATGLAKTKFFSEGEATVIEKSPHDLGRYPANVLLSWPADSYEPRPDLTDDEQAALSAWLDANA